jgi:hypothetical protein
LKPYIPKKKIIDKASKVLVTLYKDKEKIEIEKIEKEKIYSKRK